MNSHIRHTFIAATCMVSIAGLAACSSGDKSDATKNSAPAPSVVSGANIAPAEDAMLGDLIGTGCSGYTKSVPTGDGSLQGMAQSPMATAASHSPMLTTLSSALSGKFNKSVNLVDTLNSGQFTVFAPTDAAFKAMSSGSLAQLKANKAALAKTLTYHVVAGQLSPTKVIGKQPTVEGDTINVTGSGNDLKVNGVGVVCGGVKTANATVYLINGVLTPPAK